MEPFGNLISYQPIQSDPGVIGIRTFLKMEVGMINGLVTWIIGFLRIDDYRCFLVKPDDPWSLWWFWKVPRSCIQQGTKEFEVEVTCFVLGI